MKSIFSLSILALLLASSCDNSTKSTAKKSEDFPLQQLSNDKTAPKQQMFLHLTDEIDNDSSKIYIARSLFNEDTVAVQVEVLKAIKPGLTSDGKVDQKAGFQKGSIKLSSVGLESDNFVKALASLFNIPATGGMTQNVLVPTVFSSNKEVVDFSKPATYSFKLFFDNPNGEPAEMFAVVDTYRKSFVISEKDPAYRVGILTALEGK